VNAAVDGFSNSIACLCLTDNRFWQVYLVDTNTVQVQQISFSPVDKVQVLCSGGAKHLF
jgi:hypothetical protein